MLGRVASEASPEAVAAARAMSRSLAAAEPESMLPCPLCAAAVRGDNLARHLEKVHGERQPSSEPAPGTYRWTGPFRRLPPLAFLPLVAAAGWAALVLVAGLHLPAPADLVIITALLLTFFALVIAAEADRLTASMTFDGKTFSLRRSLGFRSRRVHLPATLEVGSVMENVVANTRIGDQFYAYDKGTRRVGGYLRLDDGAGEITVAGNPSVKELWDGSDLRVGKRRLRYDLRLDPPAFATLVYALAARGMLHPRRRPNSGL